jgi:DNA polymerase-4
MALNWLLIDFNSYFSSVEQLLRPELRGKPIAVVPVMAESTCCIAASYEAKKFGIKTGTRVSDARMMCRGIAIVEARPSLYVEFHEALCAAIESCIHVEKVWSIDEMLCELTGKLKEREKALELAAKIKKTIAEKVGAEMRCSIGIAPNPFLAKAASDMQKPDGLVVIEKEDLPQCLYSFKLRDFYGVGRNMEQRLLKHGIRTGEELCAATEEDLRQVWGGIEGERIYHALRGESVYRPPTQSSSIGHSHVMPPEERNPAAAFAVLNRLLQKAAGRLRKMKYYAGAMQLSISSVREGHWSEECSFLETQDTVEFLRILRLLWDRRPANAPAPMKVGVTLMRLVEEHNRTPAFFEKTSQRDKLNAQIDSINKTFGKNTIYFAGAHVARKSAPMRIAFTYIPDLDDTDKKELPPEQQARLKARQSCGKKRRSF